MLQAHIDEYGPSHPKYSHRDGDKLIEELVMRALLPRSVRAGKVQRLALTWKLLPHDNVAFSQSEHGIEARQRALIETADDQLAGQQAPPKSRPGFMQARGLRARPWRGSTRSP